MSKISKIEELKQITTISEDLEQSLQADVIAGQDQLSKAITFNKMFAGMDSDLLKAGQDAAELEFYLTGAAVNKKFVNVFQGSGKNTYMQVGQVGKD